MPTTRAPQSVRQDEDGKDGLGHLEEEFGLRIERIARHDERVIRGRIHEDEPGHAKKQHDDPLAYRVKNSIEDGAVGDEAGELVHDPLYPGARHCDEPLYRLVDRLANEPEEDEARKNQRCVDSETEHARVHAEEVTWVAAEELVAKRLLQLVSNEAFVRDGERGQE